MMAKDQGVRRLGRYLAMLSVFGWGCDSGRKSDADEAKDPAVVVLRVESLSPEKPGAEHCDAEGQKCSPLAPQQKLKAEGLVRTFAGGKVSLDFGGGRRVDLDGLSETQLSPKNIKLKRGAFSLESTPLVQKENFSPLTFVAAGRELSMTPDKSTTTAISVQDESATLTVRRGGVDGLDAPGFDKNSSQSGQTIRIANAQTFRTSIGGRELPALPVVAPRADEFGGLLSGQASEQSRGLGTMTARLPNTKQVRDGVNLNKHHVRVVIRDGYARTEIEEEFENTTPHVLEGRYRFPVPGDASLSRLALWVGDDLIEGEVLERDRAAKIYSSIVDRPIPRDPALLEWVTGGEMSLKVFPILPKKSRKVVLAYNQALSTESGRLRYVYPLSLGQGRETKIGEFSISVHLSDTKGTLENIRVPNHEARIGTEGNWKTVTVSLKDTAPSRDFVVLADTHSGSEAQLSAYVPAWGAPKDKRLSSSHVGQGSESGHFALRVSADLPEGAKRPTTLPQDRAIVLDVSQSQSKATLAAQGALAFGILRSMDPKERFVLLACDSACQTFPASGPTEATPSAIEKARDYLSEIAPGGSSDLAGALVAGAAQLRSSQSDGKRDAVLVLIGDGKASSGELSAETIASRAKKALDDSQVDLRIIAAGRTVDDDLLSGLALELGATLEHLRSGSSLEERIGQLAMNLRRPVIRDAKLVLPPSLRSEDALTLPALRLGQEVVVTGQVLDLEGGEVLLSGTLEGEPYRHVKGIKWEKTSEAQNPLVPRLWARAKLKKLHAAEETPAVKAEIIRLSKEHRTMSRHTSFLVLESEKMYKDFNVERTTKSEDDQVDSKFSELGLTDADFEEPEEAEAPSDVTSFEDLSSLPQTKGTAREMPVPRPARAQPKPRPASRGMEKSGRTPWPRPAPAPAPAPAPMPKKSAKPKSIAGSLDSLGSSAARGSASTSSGRRAVDPLERWEPPPRWRPRPRPIPRRRNRRARLTFTQADDEWRKWGDDNIARLVEKLAQDNKSRARNEAYIRGHLQFGRFAEARRMAQSFVDMDPDYSIARELLAYSAVVDGDHELARQMLDVQAETDPRNLLAHAQSARGFEAVGDIVRACSHYRSLAELAPKVDEARERAEACWAEILGTDSDETKKDEGKPGQLQVDVKCDDGVRRWGATPRLPSSGCGCPEWRCLVSVDPRHRTKFAHPRHFREAANRHLLRHGSGRRAWGQGQSGSDWARGEPGISVRRRRNAHHSQDSSVVLLTGLQRAPGSLLYRLSCRASRPSTCPTVVDPGPSLMSSGLPKSGAR